MDHAILDEYVHILENGATHTLTLPTVFGTRTLTTELYNGAKK